MLRSAAHEGGRDDRAQRCQGREDEIGRAPADAGDQFVRQRRADKRADADAGNGNAARRPAAALEPALDRRDAGHIREADAHAHAKTVTEVDGEQAAGL